MAMLLVLLLVPSCSMATDAYIGSPRACWTGEVSCTAACSRGLCHDFHGVANRVLPGHGYRNLTVAWKVLCGRECLLDDRCFSFHYSDGERRCELNGATASRFPLALTEEVGTNYFGPEEPYFDHLLTAGTEEEGPPGITDCWYQTHELASSECLRTGQHLCLQWELQHAYNQGYPATTPASWYADPDRQAVMTAGTGVTYHDPPLTAPSPGLCCSRPLSYRHPVITKGSYDLADRDGQASGCSDLAAHLCTLAELKEAHQRGYRSDYWGYIATPDRDASVAGCTGYHTGSECYEGTIANTPRPGAPKSAWCCPDSFLITLT